MTTPSGDGPIQDAVRTARRATRRASFHARADHAPWLFGMVLIGLGVLFLLDNLNLVEARFFFRNLWPLLIMGFGISRLMTGEGGERVVGALATVFGGFWLADRLLDWDINVVGVFWPLILIGIGINLLIKRRGTSPYDPSPVPPLPPLPGNSPGAAYSAFADGASTGSAADVDHSASIREVAILSGIERRNVSQTFRGGTITAIMGSVELDLRDCRMTDPTASIFIQEVMGHIALRLPPTWAVDSRLSTILSSLEDRSDRPVESTPNILILEGSVFMGQIELRN
jgi:predicted membrane protein